MINTNDFTANHDFLLSLIAGVPYGIIAIDLQGYITIANTRSIKLLDLPYKVNDLVEQEILPVLNEVDELRTEIESCLKKGRRDFDIEELAHAGKYLNCRGRKILDGMIITMADITQIKESEYLALNALLEGQEQERKRLAREIHDGIGPTLSTLKMNLAHMEGDISGPEANLTEKFKKSYQMIDEVADDLRSISHNLMPKVLSDFGLVAALETLCEKIDATKSIKVVFIHNGIDKRLSEAVELGLYRISQELINNTLKYAEAKKINLQLLKRDGSLQLMYEDDGKGFYPDLISSGIGLTNIENRTKALAGEVILDSQPGRGMTATIEIPLNA